MPGNDPVFVTFYSALHTELIITNLQSIYVMT